MNTDLSRLADKLSDPSMVWSNPSEGFSIIHAAFAFLNALSSKNTRLKAQTYHWTQRIAFRGKIFNGREELHMSRKRWRRTRIKYNARRRKAKLELKQRAKTEIVSAKVTASDTAYVLDKEP